MFSRSALSALATPVIACFSLAPFFGTAVASEKAQGTEAKVQKISELPEEFQQKFAAEKARELLKAGVKIPSAPTTLEDIPDLKPIRHAWARIVVYKQTTTRVPGDDTSDETTVEPLCRKLARIPLYDYRKSPNGRSEGVTISCKAATKEGLAEVHVFPSISLVNFPNAFGFPRNGKFFISFLAISDHPNKGDFAFGGSHSVITRDLGLKHLQSSLGKATIPEADENGYSESFFASVEYIDQ